MWLATSEAIWAVSSFEKRSLVQIASAMRVPTSACPLKRMRPPSSDVSRVAQGGLPTSCSSALQASVAAVPGSSFSSSSSVCTQTSPSGCQSGCCSTPCMRSTSGNTSRSNPVRSSSSKAYFARPSVSIRVSSSRIRSALTWWIVVACERIALSVSASSAKPKRAAKRTARSMRNLSSAKRRAGSPIARTSPAARSRCPPT